MHYTSALNDRKWAEFHETNKVCLTNLLQAATEKRTAEAESFDSRGYGIKLIIKLFRFNIQNFLKRKFRASATETQIN